MSIEKMGNPENGSEKVRVLVEMEVYDKDGNELEGRNLWEEVEVYANDDNEAIEKAINEIYARPDEKRIPNGYAEIITPKNSIEQAGESDDSIEMFDPQTGKYIPAKEFFTKYEKRYGKR